MAAPVDAGPQLESRATRCASGGGAPPTPPFFLTVCTSTPSSQRRLLAPGRDSAGGSGLRKSPGFQGKTYFVF